MIQKNTDFAYFAGYLDGDGCFYIGFARSKNRLNTKPEVCIKISSTNKNVLLYFKKIFGGSVCLIKAKHNNSKALFQYTARKRNFINFIKSITPYLVEKIEEANLALNFAQSKDKKYQQECISTMKILKDTTNLVSKHHKKAFEKYKNNIKPTKECFAYLGGFIDAECSLGISRYKPKNRPNYTYKIMLQCNNTKYPVFKWLLERFGGHINFINRLKTQKARKNQLCWRLSGRSLSLIINQIHEFLLHKKPVCEELINFYKTTLPNGGARHTDLFRQQYAAIMEIRERIVSNIHKLNLKGINTI